MSFVPCKQIWSILDSSLRHLLLMMSECPLAIHHEKGEYICKGVFVVRGRFLETLLIYVSCFTLFIDLYL